MAVGMSQGWKEGIWRLSKSGVENNSVRSYTGAEVGGGVMDEDEEWTERRRHGDGERDEMQTWERKY